MGEVRHLAVEALVESAVVVVDVEVVAFVKIVRDVDVRPAIAIDVADHHAEPEGDLAAVDAGLGAYICEVPVAIAVEQLLATEWIAHVSGVARADASDGTEGVVDEKEIQTPVAVIVQESRLSGRAFVGNAICGGHLLEGRDAVRVQTLIDVQLVRPPLTRDVAGVANVDVQPAIAIDIGQSDSRSPQPFAFDSRFLSDVLELEVTFVEIEVIAVLVGGEHDLGQTISIQVPDGYSTAVVVIAVGEDVELGRFLESVREVDAGVARRKQRE